MKHGKQEEQLMELPSGNFLSQTNGIFHKSTYTISQDGPLYILRGQRLYFSKCIVFFSLKIDFV